MATSITELKQRYDNGVDSKIGVLPRPHIVFPHDAAEAMTRARFDGSGFVLPDLSKNQEVWSQATKFIGKGIWIGLSVRQRHLDVFDTIGSDNAQRARAGWVDAMDQLGLPETYDESCPLPDGAVSTLVSQLYATNPYKVNGLLRLFEPIGKRIYVNGNTPDEAEFTTGILDALGKRGVVDVTNYNPSYRGVRGLLSKLKDTGRGGKLLGQSDGVVVRDPYLLGRTFLGYPDSLRKELLTNDVLRAALYKSILFAEVARHYGGLADEITAELSQVPSERVATLSSFRSLSSENKVPRGVVILDDLQNGDGMGQGQHDNSYVDQSELSLTEAIQLLGQRIDDNTRQLDAIHTTLRRADVNPDAGAARTALLMTDEVKLEQLLRIRDGVVQETQQVARQGVRTSKFASARRTLRDAAYYCQLEALMRQGDATDLPVAVATVLCEVVSRAGVLAFGEERYQISQLFQTGIQEINARLSSQERELAAKQALLQSGGAVV